MHPGSEYAGAPATREPAGPCAPLLLELVRRARFVTISRYGAVHVTWTDAGGARRPDGCGATLADALRLALGMPPGGGPDEGEARPPATHRRAGGGKGPNAGSGVRRRGGRWQARAYDRALGRQVTVGWYGTDVEAGRAVAEARERVARGGPARAG